MVKITIDVKPSQSRCWTNNVCVWSFQEGQRHSQFHFTHQRCICACLCAFGRQWSCPLTGCVRLGPRLPSDGPLGAAVNLPRVRHALCWWACAPCAAWSGSPGTWAAGRGRTGVRLSNRKLLPIGSLSSSLHRDQVWKMASFLSTLSSSRPIRIQQMKTHWWLIKGLHVVALQEVKLPTWQAQVSRVWIWEQKIVWIVWYFAKCKRRGSSSGSKC